ncbi:hypothetical protein NIES970_29220 (plasmid) [[Synechococcus] sp. NIES-970]|nr:hypothetical protein NIES970_29220 [[Synechococcus] sp. NIES-970]
MLPQIFPLLNSRFSLSVLSISLIVSLSFTHWGDASTSLKKSNSNAIIEFSIGLCGQVVRLAEYFLKYLEKLNIFSSPLLLELDDI